MAGNSFFLGGIDLAGATLARVDERDAVSTYADLIEEVRGRCGDEVASLFAEPVRGANRVTGGQSISWYCPFEGTPFALRQLDGAGRGPVVELLKQRLRSFSSLFGDPRSGAALGSWLYLLSADSIMAVAGQPVIKNWGMVPADVASSEEARDTHVRNTVGLYLPSIPTPPFTALEAPSFAGRMAQLAERETARRSPPAPLSPPLVAPPAASPASLAVAGRPWFAPAIASSAAAMVLLALLFGHLLRYPEAAPADPDAAAVEAQRQTNAALRDQLDRLRKGVADVCLSTPATATPGRADAPPPLLPPSPAVTRVTSVEPGATVPTVGTLGSLLDKATVVVVAGDGWGSGFFVSDRHIVTNHHVVGDLTDVKVGSKALGGLVAAHVLAVGAGDKRGTQDLAVLEITPKPGPTPLQVGVVPERLEPLTASGYPGAVIETIKGAPAAFPEANFTQGILTSHQMQAPAGIGTIIHTAQIGHGNSGGPLVDPGGCAVGVNSWLSFDHDDDTVFSSYFQALDAAELRKFLKAHDIAFASADATCQPVAAAPAAPALAAPPTPAPAASMPPAKHP